MEAIVANLDLARHQFHVAVENSHHELYHPNMATFSAWGMAVALPLIAIDHGSGSMTIEPCAFPSGRILLYVSTALENWSVSTLEK